MIRKYSGHVVDLPATKTFGSGFKKREIIVQEGDCPFENPLTFELGGDKIGIADGLVVGDEVEIDASTRGRKWDSPNGERKYFLSLKAERLQVTRKQPVNESRPADAKTAVEMYTAYAGGFDPAAFAGFCKSVNGDVSSKDYTPELWQKIIDAIKAPPPAGTLDIELPF